MTAKHPQSETDAYVLFFEHEDVFLFDKDENKDVWRIRMPGNATCGLIGISNEWVVVGGQTLLLWKNDVLRSIEDDDLRYAFDMRQISTDEIEILIDPWAENSAIWLFHVKTEQKTKIRDFNDYREKLYQDSVEW